MFKKYFATSVHMNTQVKFITWSNLNEKEISNYFKQAKLEFERIENLYSRFKQESYLSQFNLRKFSQVTQEFFEITFFLLLFANLTNGVFDPTIIDILETYGYDKNYNFSKLDDKTNLENNLKNLLKTRNSYKDIIFEIKDKCNVFKGNIEYFANLISNTEDLHDYFSDDFYKLFKFTLNCEFNHSKENLKQIANKNIQYTIYLAENQRIEFGGCGKGFAIDKVYEILKPLENFIIDAGGDIRAFGNIENRKWSASLFNTAQAIELNSGDSFCCSGSSARKVKFFHHLINPKSAKPQNDFSQVFVY